ncbi:RNA recognition motif domain-containing protein [Ditylenchus destructor]|nr:RNA recognition motif domain-containing protein [Ditylenchus destructor]
MNLECQVCTGNKIGTSFCSLDDLQAHLFSNHHDGPLDVFKFVCHKCEFKFGTEYRLLRHEEKCGRESRSEEDMERIQYKFKMYELLELTLKYNMTKHQVSGARPANPYNIGTLETRESPQAQFQTESLGSKEMRRENSDKNGSGPSIIINESRKSLGNLWTVKAEVQDQNCSIDSAYNTQSYVETEPEDVDTSEVEVLGSVEIRKRKAPPKPAEHRSGVSAQQNVNSAGESSNLRHAKQAKTNLDEKQIPRFNSARDQEERMATSTPTVSNLTNRINVNGPCLHLCLDPDQADPKPFQKEELRTYFSQFGKISSISVQRATAKNIRAKVTFDNCDSAAKCIQQHNHKICGRDFVVRKRTPSQGMKEEIRANLRQNMSGPSSENVSVDSNRIL